MTYFKALLSKSGEPYQLQACQVSIKSFLSGLNYNKCKRMDGILET